MSFSRWGSTRGLFFPLFFRCCVDLTRFCRWTMNTIAHKRWRQESVRLKEKDGAENWGCHFGEQLEKLLTACPVPFPGQTSTSALSTEPATTSASTPPAASSATATKATSSTASRTAEVSQHPSTRRPRPSLAELQFGHSSSQKCFHFCEMSWNVASELSVA